MKLKLSTRIISGLLFLLFLGGGLTSIGAQGVFNRAFDFDGNGEADFAVRRESDRSFYILHATNNWTRGLTFGFASNVDRNVVGDFDGDGKGDIAVYRQGQTAGEQNVYYVLQSSTNTIRAQPWGVCCADFNFSRDYDGDGKTDFAVGRADLPGTPGVFYILQSTNNQLRVVYFGRNGDGNTFGDVPVPNDYDGDGKADLAVYRFDVRQNPQIPDRNTFYVLQSTNNQIRAQQWGDFTVDYETPGDFDGDGKGDFAVFRGFGGGNGVWYILQSSNNQIRSTKWGLDGDIPVQKDYDGDGKTDLAVRRGANWFVLRSANNQIQTVNWGLGDDFALNYVGNQ